MASEGMASDTDGGGVGTKGSPPRKKQHTTNTNDDDGVIEFGELNNLDLSGLGDFDLNDYCKSSDDEDDDTPVIEFGQLNDLDFSGLGADFNPYDYNYKSSDDEDVTSSSDKDGGRPTREDVTIDFGELNDLDFSGAFPPGTDPYKYCQSNAADSPQKKETHCYCQS